MPLRFGERNHCRGRGDRRGHIPRQIERGAVAPIFGDQRLQQTQRALDIGGVDHTGEPLQLVLEGEFARASVLRARVRTEVDLARIPLFGSIGTVEVSGDAAAPVDRYRSLLGSPSP